MSLNSRNFEGFLRILGHKTKALEHLKVFAAHHLTFSPFNSDFLPLLGEFGDLNLANFSPKTVPYPPLILAAHGILSFLFSKLKPHSCFVPFLAAQGRGSPSYFMS